MEECNKAACYADNNAAVDEERVDESVAKTAAVLDSEDDCDTKCACGESTAESNDANEIAQLEKKITELTAEVSAQKNQYMRTLADFDNYRKNAIKDKANALKYKSEALGRDIIAVVDDFERAIGSFKETDDEYVSGLHYGMEMIYNKLVFSLEKNSIKKIAVSTGDKFDTDVHEALSMLQIPDKEMDGKVIACTQNGYTVGDKVMRYAKVCVGKYVTPTETHAADETTE